MSNDNTKRRFSIALIYEYTLAHFYVHLIQFLLIGNGIK